jgi:hypothetical protein
VASEDELYVGYAAHAPAVIARHTRRTVAALAAVAAVLPLVLLAAQAAFAPAAFEYGVVRTYRGTVRALPVARLVVARPGGPEAVAGVSQLLLVAPGKHGAAPDVAPLDGRAVELTGTLVYRDGRTMLELLPESLRPLEATPLAEPAVEDLGTRRLRGEIVDSKCHLGVMRPGEGKTHRDCAARCLSGGIPAALRMSGAGGVPSYVLLLGGDGRAINREILDRVAEPVEITGRLERRGDLAFLYAEPDAIRRLDGERRS